MHDQVDDPGRKKVVEFVINQLVPFIMPALFYQLQKTCSTHTHTLFDKLTQQVRTLLPLPLLLLYYFVPFFFHFLQKDSMNPPAVGVGWVGVDSSVRSFLLLTLETRV